MNFIKDMAFMKKTKNTKKQKQKKIYFNDQECTVITMIKTYDIISGIDS